MKYAVVSVYDKKAHCYCPPFVVTHLAVATRSFADVANDASAAVGKNPEDYALFALGTWEDDAAVYELHKQPLHVVEALSLVRSKDVQH